MYFGLPNPQMQSPNWVLRKQTMLASAGLHSKPSSGFLSSTVSFHSSRLAGRCPSTGSHIIMSIISNPSNFSTAAAAPHTCWLARSQPNRKIEQFYNSICSRDVTIRFTQEGFSAPNIRCWSNLLCSNRFASQAGCSSWQRIAFETEHRVVTSSQGILSWSTLKPNCKASWDLHAFGSFCVSRIGYRGVETRFGSRSAKKFHAIVRQEGRYISASAPEEHFRFETLEEDGVEVEHDYGIERNTDRGIDKVRIAAEDIEKQNCALEIWVVNFYCFVSIEDPHLEVARHTSFLEGKDVRGRIYINHQGINAQLSGAGREAIEYAEWVKEDSRFSDMLVQISPSRSGHAFPRLRLRYKPSLVQVEGGTLHLPITDPSARAVHLSPSEWTQRLDAATVLGNNNAGVSKELGNPRDGRHDDTRKAKKPVVLLDVRNGYEWDVGHFKGAQRPNVDCFKRTEFGLLENETVSSDPLANVDKKAVDVMMYCTGGIRCDVYSTMLRQKGFKNLYTLNGGVSNYLREEGARKWAGNLFVFDSRLAVPPKDYDVKESSNEEVPSEAYTTEEVDCANSSVTQAFARCRVCGDPISEPRHRNCANLDCNLLYMSCEDCLSQHKGCCSTSCSSAPRLRPVLARHQYDRWHNYRPEEAKAPKPADYVSRRALKRKRRKERRKLLVGGTANEQLSVQILESHVSLTDVHEKVPNFAAISERQ